MPRCALPAAATPHTVIRAESGRSPTGDGAPQAAAASTAAPVFFTGEMVFPWMFDDIAALRPLKKVAEAVANAEDWSRLYDSAKLQQNRVPVAAATYCEVRRLPRRCPAYKQDSPRILHRTRQAAASA